MQGVSDRKRIRTNPNAQKFSLLPGWQKKIRESKFEMEVKVPDEK